MKLLDLPGKHERERAELEARHEKERLQLDQQQEVARLSFLESCEREQQELPTKVELRKRELIAKKEEMLRRAEQERLVLQDKFSQAEQELSTMRYAVERKHKEQELADLQAQIAGVEKRRQTAVQDLDKALQDLHAPSASDYAALEATQLAEYKKLLTKQEGERSTQRYLQEVERRELADVQKAEYTVVKVLEEFAAQEHLVFQRKRQRKWKEKKTITEGRFLWKNTREVIEDRKDLTWEPLPDGVAQTGARSWSIEGTPRGFDDTCTLVYTVNLIKGEYGGKKTRFEVVVRKNSNTYQQCVTSPEDSVRVIEPGEYTEIARTNTYEATEDSLGYTLGNLVRLEKGGACGYVIRRSQCPPPPANYTSACGGAHPIDVYGRPLEAVQLPVSSQPIWKPSKHLRVVPTPEGVALYHTLRGNLRFAPRGILEFLAEAEKGTMLSEVEARFPDVAVKDEIQEMSRLGFLTPDNQEPFIAITPRGMERGNRVRWLRLNTAVDCNLACTYCHGTNDMTVCAGSRMPVETALRAVRVFCDLLLEHNVKYMQIRSST